MLIIKTELNNVCPIQQQFKKTMDMAGEIIIRGFAVGEWMYCILELCSWGAFKLRWNGLK